MFVSIFGLKAVPSIERHRPEGLRIALYDNNLFSADVCDLLPNNRYIFSIEIQVILA